MRSDVTVAAIIILTVLVAVIWILQPVYGYVPYTPREATWEAPEIPYCDKDLWLRIIGGCPEKDKNE